MGGRTWAPSRGEEGTQLDTYQILMCAPVAGVGSDHPWCLTLTSQVYWDLWGPVRPSLEQLWIRKHLWACYGFIRHVPREGSLVQNCSFYYCFHFQKEPSSFSPVSSAWNTPYPPSPHNLHLVNPFSGLSFRSNLGCTPSQKWLTFFWIPIAPSSYAYTILLPYL